MKPEEILSFWLKKEKLPTYNTRGPMSASDLLKSPDSLRPYQREWLLNFIQKYGKDIKAL